MTADGTREQVLEATLHKILESTYASPHVKTLARDGLAGLEGKRNLLLSKRMKENKRIATLTGEIPIDSQVLRHALNGLENSFFPNNLLDTDQEFAMYSIRELLVQQITKEV